MEMKAVSLQQCKLVGGEVCTYSAGNRIEKDAVSVVNKDHGFQNTMVSAFSGGCALHIARVHAELDGIAPIGTLC